MRIVRIFLIGVAGLFVAIALRFWLKYAMVIVAGLPLLMIIAGQLYLPESKRSIRLWMNPNLLPYTDQVSLRLSGKPLSLGYFKQWHDFQIEVCHRWLLAILILASFAGILVIWETDDLPMPNVFWGWGTGAWFLVCTLAWRWFCERRAVSTSGFALGTFRVTGQAGPLLKQISYQFVDHEGEYYGGSLRSLFCDAEDDLTVVFHDEARPEVSIPASAMIFHF